MSAASRERFAAVVRAGGAAGDPADVRLDLAPPVGAEFEVTSFNGEIRNCFGPKPVRTSEYAPGTELRFKEGQGTARVRIKTLNGDIGICNK